MKQYDGFEDLLTSQAGRIPDRAALLYEKNGSTASVTWRELLAMSRRRARELSDTGKSCIGILCDGSLDCVVTMFGSVLAGLQTVLLGEAHPKSCCRSRSARRTWTCSGATTNWPKNFPPACRRRGSRRTPEASSFSPPGPPAGARRWFSRTAP